MTSGWRRASRPVPGEVPGAETIAGCQGRSGKLALRRRGDDLEVILNGAFLISTANEASSRALVTVALPYVPGDGLEVLIGGLGLGYALDEALACPRVARVTAVEYEPVVVDWFRRWGEGRAERAAAGERAGRARVVVADVADVLAASSGAFDLVCLDTDNGPRWLVREENSFLYLEQGVRAARDALRPGGAAVFWSPARYAEFEVLLSRVFARTHAEPAYDLVDGRRHAYTMYVGVRA
jgi:spermidine synthase